MSDTMPPEEPPPPPTAQGRPASPRPVGPNGTAATHAPSPPGRGAGVHAGPPSAEFAFVACPNCRRAVRLERAKLRPGRFRLRCGACHDPFGLAVDARLEPRAGRLSAAREAQADDELPPDLAAALGMTAPPPPRPVRDAAAIPSPGQIPSPTRALSPASPPADTVSGVQIAGNSATHAPTLEPTRMSAYDTPAPPTGPEALAAALSARAASSPPAIEPAAGDRLGPYHLKRKLGQGGMGAVFLADQTTLGRDVAVKVLAPRLSAQAAFVGRFLREAYAAGQLVHHNVVQIYDFGRDVPRRPGTSPGTSPGGASGAAPGAAPGGPIHYFSMELVDGRSLQALVASRGRLEAKEAVGLVLQAARGLAFAHGHGLIHRDVKPDNLMLNRLGVVKVADLGLVRRAGDGGEEAADDAATIEPAGDIAATAAARITQHGAMMGTPAYLSPEQAVDAKSVDARADVYSLGCTLYHLVVGRPPFGGKTLREVLDAHRYQKLTFPDPASPNAVKVAASLQEILRRMCGKSPDERYRSMDEVVGALEGHLADKHQADGEPEARQVQALAWAAQQFQASGWARARPAILAAFAAALLGLAAAVVTSVTDPLLAFGLLGGLVGVGAMSLLFGFLFAGAQRRDALYVRSRRLAREATWRDRLVAAVGGLLLVAVLASFGWLWWWLGAAVVAVGLGMVWAKVVDRGARGDCEPMVRRAEMAVREMRENGVDETRVRRAVAEAGGARWEPFYEALFGYEAKLAARGIYGTDGRGSAGAWRDPLAAWLDARLDGRRARRDERLLTQAAAGELVARGVPEAAAERQAINQARRELAKAHLLREQIRAELRRELRREAAGEEKPAADAAGSPEPSPAAGDHGAGGGGGPGDGKIRPKPVKYTDDDFERVRESYFRRRYGSPLDLLLGPQVRFALGAVLLICFAAWFNQNQRAIFVGDAAQGSTARQADLNALAGGGRAARRPIDDDPAWWQRLQSGTSDLRLPGASDDVTRWLGGLHVGVAGLLLAAGAFFYGRALGAAQLSAAGAVMVATPLLVGRPDWLWLPAAAGAVIWAAATFLLRTADD